MMQAGCELYQSDEGIVRRDGAGIALLAEERTLAEVARAGALAALAEAPVRMALAALPAVLEAPLATGQVALVGLNYASHAAEVGQPLPSRIVWACLPGAELAAPGTAVKAPAGSERALDYEGEVAVIVGAPLDNADPDAAEAAIAAIAAGIDFTARDLQMKALAGGPDAPTMAAAKTFAGSKPIGPGLRLWDAQAGDLRLETRVNGEPRQSCAVNEMLFSPAQILGEISRTLPLHPGDVVFTGTPAGVGFVAGRSLAAGDVVEVALGDLAPLRAVVA